MAWIWSDELAAAAEAEGLDHTEIASWRVRPVAFSLQSGQPATTLARQLLGLVSEPTSALEPSCDSPSSDEAAVEAPGTVTCSCGAMVDPTVLASEAVGR